MGKNEPVFVKPIRWIVPLKRGKLTDTKENQKLKQNVWIGWEVMYMDGTHFNIEVGEFNTLQQLYNHKNTQGIEHEIYK